jgi:hypothetical protein
VSLETPLAELQRWMQAELVRPPGRGRSASELARVERELRPPATLAAAERLDLVASMVRERLVGCLREDYAGVRHALGEREFERLALEYLEAHPSTHYSLNRLGRGLPEFLRARRPRARFVAELAELERAVQVVFDAPQEPGLDAAAVLAVPPERWPQLRLRTIAALELCAGEFPGRRYLKEVYEGRAPRRPRRERSWTLVHRRDFAVWRVALDADRWTLLAALREGVTVSTAIERCLGRRGASRERVASEVGGWFREWAAEGLFAAAVDGD